MKFSFRRDQEVVEEQLPEEPVPEEVLEWRDTVFLDKIVSGKAKVCCASKMFDSPEEMINKLLLMLPAESQLCMEAFLQEESFHLNAITLKLFEKGTLVECKGVNDIQGKVVLEFSKTLENLNFENAFQQEHAVLSRKMVWAASRHCKLSESETASLSGVLC